MSTTQINDLQIDIYPVGWLDALLYAWRVYSRRDPGRTGIAEGRRFARSRLHGEAVRTVSNIRRGRWRELKNTFNGHLAEPYEFPPGDYRRRCGTGWTKARALRSLQRRLPKS